MCRVPEPWLVGFETRGHVVDPAEIGFDAAAEFVPHGLNDLLSPMPTPPLCDPSNSVYDYPKVAAAYAGRRDPSWIRYPCVAAGWDNTPRRRNGEALVLSGSTPERYGQWLEQSMRKQARTQGADGVVFVNAWNEWAEGAHLEPDATHGRVYLEATRNVVESLGGSCPPLSLEVGADVPAPAPIEDLYANLYERFVDLQKRSSGFLAIADRRLQSWRDHYAKELEKLRSENRRLAEWSLSLEEQVEFRRRQLQELEHPVHTADDVVSALWTGGPDGN